MATICVFCCTHIKSDDWDNDGNGSCPEETIKTFLKVTNSHLNIKVANISELEEDGDTCEKTCLKCEQSLKSICELYRDLEGIRLKMEWELRELIKKMEIEGRTPSKVKWLRGNQQANEFQKMSNFRNDFISKCNQSLVKSMPTITLERVKFQEIPKELFKIEEGNDELFQESVNFSDDNFDDIEDSQIELGNPKEKKRRPRKSIKKPFKCPNCPAQYYEQKNLVRHQRSHHPQLLEPEIIRKCAYANCSASFTTLLQLKRHKREFHEDKDDNGKETTCPICGKTSSRFRNLTVHMKNLHKDESPQLPFACDIPQCPKRFPNEAVLKWHRMFYYHGNRASPSNTTTPPSILNDSDDKSEAIYEPPVKQYISCPHCSIKFTLRSSLLRHVKKRHLQQNHPNRKLSLAATYFTPSISPVLNEDLQDTKPDHDNLPSKNFFECPHCPGTKFTTEKYLLAHQTTKSHQRQLTNKVPKLNKYATCTICKQVVKKVCLHSHFNVNHKIEDLDPQNVQKCDHPNCPAYFRTVFLLQRHKRIVHSVNDTISRTTCPICGKSFTEVGNLKLHMKNLHHDESPDLPLACDVIDAVPKCLKRFPNEDILNWHRKYYYHSKKEKSIEIINCPECNRECQGKLGLRTHLKRHRRPEAPYVCELCGAAFKNKCILRNHGYFHKGPDNWAFQCETCGKRCATEHYLREHMYVHSDIKRFSCHACGKGYKCRRHLRKHVNKFHAQEGFQDIPRKTTKPKLISRRVTKKKVD